MLVEAELYIEEVFTCEIPGDTNTPVSVGIYYPSELNVHTDCHLLMCCILLVWCTLLTLTRACAAKRYCSRSVCRLVGRSVSPFSLEPWLL